MYERHRKRRLAPPWDTPLPKRGRGRPRLPTSDPLRIRRGKLLLRQPGEPRGLGHGSLKGLSKARQEAHRLLRALRRRRKLGLGTDPELAAELAALVIQPEPPHPSPPRSAATKAPELHAGLDKLARKQTWVHRERLGLAPRSRREASDRERRAAAAAEAQAQAERLAELAAEAERKAEHEAILAHEAKLEELREAQRLRLQFGLGPLSPEQIRIYQQMYPWRSGTESGGVDWAGGDRYGRGGNVMGYRFSNKIS